MKIVPQLDKSKFLISWGQTIPGRLILTISTGVLLWLLGQWFWWLAALIYMASGLFPNDRKWILAAGTFTGLAFHYVFNENIQFHYLNFVSPLLGPFLNRGIVALVEVGAMFLLLWFFIYLKSRWSVVNRRPVLIHLTFFALLLAVFSSLKLPTAIAGYLWIFLLAWNQSIWFINYILVQKIEPTAKEALLQFGFVRQYMHYSSVPKGKSWRYLEGFNSKTADELAKAQLNGIKLLLWTCVLVIIRSTLRYSLFKDGSAWVLSSLNWTLNLPSLQDTFYGAANGHPYSWYYGWIALLADFPLEILDLAITGHIAVACIRISGFSIPRNTWRPFEAMTIADFWNRYYYYFKELLVDFFFFPTFARYFKSNMKLRTMAATIAAACFGNFIYHFFFSIGNIPRLGFLGAIWYLHTYFFYTIILTVGICASQIRILNGKKRPATPGRQIIARLGVYAFFALTAIFNMHLVTGDIRDNFRFVASLFGLQF